MTTLKIKDADGATKHVATTGTGTADDPIKTQQSITGAVEISQALPAGENIIGKVEVTAMPPISVGDISIGEVTIGAALPAGENNIGNVDIVSFPPSMVSTDKLKVEATATEFDIRDLSSDTDSVASVQSGTWSVGVSNFPASFQVSNLPATQTIAGSVDLGATGNLVISSDVQAVRDRLPATLGGKTAASSFPVTLSTDGPFATNFGLQADAAAAGDTDTTSFLGLFKRLLQRVTALINSVGLDTTLQSIRDRLPVTLGTKTAANSLPVTLSSDGAFSTNFGSTSDSAATTDTGSFSLLALFKRLLSVTLAKGQAVMASSISVAIASNQSAIPVTLPSTQIPANYAPVTTSGTVAAGKYSVTFCNFGSAAGLLLGNSFPAGASINFTPPPGMTLSAIAYDATGTTFLIGSL
ncbi:hypothetical protein [Nostoc sp. GT001]|uniref:hypothetical protein n=1 Tax=Nostoc sp. GT001 TaxID=3056647 RepID=UPI0025AA8410|nr:hypothetical protein [Nostoc sp. GT001]MDM9583108.1 hypothetical protein [Nostoc sp. GT001]